MPYTDSDYQIGDTVISIHPFKALHENELSFAPNLIITIVSKHTNGWICGETPDAIGWFPEDFVKPHSKKPKTIAPSTSTPTSTVTSPRSTKQSHHNSTPNKPKASAPHNMAIAETSNFIARTLTSLFQAQPSRQTLVDKGILKLGLVFAVPLDQLIEKTHATIPPICSQSFNAIERKALTESGIYRISGSLAQVQKLKQLYDTGTTPSLSGEPAPVIASLLKLYLRELVEPLFPFNLYDIILAIGHSPPSSRLPPMIKLVNQLPINRQNLLKALLHHLSKISAHSSENLMTPKNLAICFAPTLIRKEVETLQSSMQDSQFLVSFMETMISSADSIIHNRPPETTASPSARGAPARHPPSNSNITPATTSAPPAEEPFLCHVVAKFDYTGRNDKELSFKEGDIIGIRKKGQTGWWKGVLNGKKGMVASTYLEELSSDDPRIPRTTPSPKPSRSPSTSRRGPPKGRGSRRGGLASKQPSKAQTELQAKLNRRRQGLD